MSEAQRLLEAWFVGPVVCSEVRRLEGGLVNSVFLLEIDRPPWRAVVKMHRNDGETLATEARALDYLRSETNCPVPSVYLQDSSTSIVPFAFLLLEHLPGLRLNSLDLAADARADIDVQLAQVLGELHSHHGTEWGGIDLGVSAKEWSDLFAVRLAEARSHPAVVDRLSRGVLADVDVAIELARSVLRSSGEPTLVHGDVWDGNLLVRQEGRRWLLSGLLDPDLQFADVELELAYLEVFDTSREAFFSAYAHLQAVRPGYEQRRLFYWLHTALVHVALFGDDLFRRYTARIAEQIARLQIP